MTIQRISSGSKFEDLAAYSRAVVDDRYVHVSGTVGIDRRTGTIPDDVTQQTRNILGIVEVTLADLGLDFSDVVRDRVYLTSGDSLMEVAAILRELFETCPPANTTLICGIPAPGAKVEIEVTARLRPKQD